MRTKIDKTYLRLVNRENPLEKHKPEFYEYDEVSVRIPNHEISSDDIVIDRGERSSIVKTFIEKKTNQAFEELKADLARKGINVRINEAGRTVEKQILYRKNAEENHGIEYADNYVAKPYETEHGLGTAVDIGVFSKAISNIKNTKVNNALHKIVRKLILYPVMHKTAVKHGFITRYPVKYNLTNERRKEIQAMKEDVLDFNSLPMDENGQVIEPADRKVTIKSSGKEFKKLTVQYNYEPWHETYVGKFNAQFMTANNLTLEEYVKLVDIYEAYADSFEDESQCLSLQQFHNLYTLGNEWDDRNM